MNRPDLLAFGRSPEMLRVFALCARFAACSLPVLIVGEAGTGKTELARTIHRKSRRTGDFVEDSAAALPEGMELAALLGHSRGSFTGAVADETGLVEAAKGGTYFIDEIDSASPRLQAFLLKLLEKCSVRRIGEVRSREFDVRFIAATNADLGSLIQTGQFRQDLRDRFGYFVIDIPPLARRRDEIQPLAEHFLRNEATRLGLSAAPKLAPEVTAALQHAPWPGNIRELRSLCEFLAAICSNKDWIDLEDLPPQFTNTLSGSRSASVTPTRVEEAIALAGGNRTVAAKSLGISPRHLYRLLSQTKARSSRNSA